MAMGVCPIQLLYKDHKGWKAGDEKPPPTRQVAGGHMGMGLHLSEIISDLIEPMVGRLKGGREIISLEDLLARIDKLNLLNKGWTTTKWWEGKTSGKYIACGNCMGREDYIWEEELPELCNCTSLEGNTADGNPTMGRNTTSSTANSDEREDLARSPSTEGETSHETSGYGDRVVATMNFVKIRRRLEWEKLVDWDDEDLDRKLDSRDALQEDLQDYSIPLVIIGSDVISLYPNLDTTRVDENMIEIVKGANLVWSNVDLLEGARYLALNWTEEQVRRSSLRRLLPWRRSNRGTRPGMRGEGPLGMERGDQEQWEFPSVVVE